MIDEENYTNGRLLKEHMRDPFDFSKRVLRRRRWKRQEEMRISVFENRYTALVSANGIGKTNELAAIIIEWFVSNPGGRVIVTGPTFEAARLGVWAEVRQQYFEALSRGVKLGGEMLKESWVMRDRWDCVVASVDNISAIQGRRGSKVLIVVDEAQGVEDIELKNALTSLMSDPGSRMVLSGNPLMTSGWFHEAAHSSLYNVIFIDGFEHPNVVEGRTVFPGAISRIWIDERKEECGDDYENHPVWQARVRGKFPTAGVNQIVTLADLERASYGTIGIDEDPRLALDVARFGLDSNVLGYFDRTRTLADLESWTGEDLMQTTGRLKNAIDKWHVNAGRVKVDVCGIGAAVVDRLREIGHRVDAVDFGANPVGEWKELLGKDVRVWNRRTELHLATAKLLRSRQLCIPKKYTKVWADLVMPRFEFKSTGEYIVEEKKAIKSRVGRSPDYGDMVQIGMSNAGGRGPRMASSAA